MRFFQPNGLKFCARVQKRFEFVPALRNLPADGAVGLLRNRMWSYPASLVVMAAFIAYQLYRYSYTFSVGLMLLTIFDVIVIALVWHEWRLMKQLRIRRI